MDALANFAYTTVTAAPIPAGSGTSMKVASGAVLPTPAPFNIVVWPANSRPLSSNAEVLRVTANAAGTLTVVRRQEGSAERAILVGDQVLAGPTQKTFTDVLAMIVELQASVASLTAQIKELGGGTPGSPTTPGKLLFGINSNSNKGHAATWTGSKVYGDRSNALDVLHTATPESVSAAVAASLAAGCKPLVIINTDDNVVLSKVVAATFAANALGIIERVIRDHPTVKVFQLLNEPYYKGSSPHGSKIGSNGAVYGAICKATYEKVEKAGLLGSVTLLLETYGEYNSFATAEKEEKQEQSGVFKHWVNDITTAFGGLKTKINGWSSHPYGSLGAANSEKNNNWGSVVVQREKAIAEGAGGVDNWWITEIGWQGEATQNADMQPMLEKALAASVEGAHSGSGGWLQAVFLYDDGDAEWTLWGRPAGETLRTFAALHG